MKAWDLFLADQEKELGVETVEKWLKPLKVARFDACNLYLQANDSFQTLWFEEHIRPKLDALANNNGKRIKVYLQAPQSDNKSKPKKNKQSSEQQAAPPEPKFALSFDELDPICTFKHFLETPANALAYKLLTKTAGYETPAELAAFNPIFIHGCAGTGKTHLLMAVAHQMRAHGMNVLYVRAETFTEHVVKAIRAGEMSIFRQAYRTMDALIIDDVHVFARKSATQEELFHTFNTQHLAGKQILLGSACAPSELQMIEPRLVSRFEWGIVLGLEPFTKEEMRGVLDKKIAALNFPLHAKVCEFLLETFKTGSKALSRAVHALILRAHLHQEGLLTVIKAKQLLADLLREEEKAALTPNKIIHYVAEHFGILTEDLQGKAQTRECVLPRQLAMYFCRHNLQLPFIKIGELFDRDHSTVMSSVKAIQKALESDNREVAGAYNAVLKKIYNSTF